MKQLIRFGIVFLVCLLPGVGWVGSPSVSAQTGTDGDSLSRAVQEVLRVEDDLSDRSYGNQIYEILFPKRASDHYNPANKNTTSEQLASVHAVIRRYRDEVEARSNQSSDTECHAERQKEFRDLGLKGLYAGTLAWIYTSNTDETTQSIVLSDLPVETNANGTLQITYVSTSVGQYYQTLAEALDKKEVGYWETQGSEAVYVYFTWLFRAVCEARLIQESPDASLSAARQANVNAVLSQAKAELGRCVYRAGIDMEQVGGTVRTDGEDGYNFSQILQKAELAIGFAEFADVLMPDTVFSELPGGDGWLSRLGEADSVADINRGLCQTADGVLASLAGENTAENTHRYAYFASLRTALAEVIGQADTQKTVCRREVLTELLRGHDLKLEKAAAKDRLAVQRAALLSDTERYPDGGQQKTKLESLFASAMAAVGGALSSEEITLYEARGEAQAKMYHHYLAATEKIEPYAGLSDVFARELKSEYTVFEGKIGGSVTPEAVRSSLREATEALDDTAAEAEAEAYRCKHAVILSKITAANGSGTFETLTLSDLLPLRAAIEDTASERMSALARGKLTSELTGIGQAFRHTVGKKIKTLFENPALTDDGDPVRQSAARARQHLLHTVDATEFSADKLPALLRTLDARLEEAVSAAAIVSHVTDVLRTEADFSAYAAEWVQHIYAVCADALQKLVSADRTETAESLRADAVLAMDRYEAAAKIHFKASDCLWAEGVAEAVDAAERCVLDEVQTSESLDRAVREFCFDADRKTVRAELQKQTESAKTAVRQMGFFAEEEILRYAARMDALFATDETGIVSASDSAVLAERKQRFEQALRDKLSEIADAHAENESRAKAEEIARLDRLLQDFRQLLNRLIFLSDSEKSDAEREAEALWEERRQAIHLTDSQKGLEEAVRPEAVQKFAKLSEKANALEELRREADECLRTIRARFAELYGDQNTYSPEQLQKVRTILDKAAAKLSEADSKEAYLAIQDEAMTAVRAISDRLSEAKDKAKETLNAVYDECLGRRKEYSERGFGEIQAIYRQALQKIESYTSLADIESLLSEADGNAVAMRGVRPQILFAGEENGEGYYGFAEARLGFTPGSRLQIYDVFLGHSSEAIVRAAKNRRILSESGTLISDDVNRLLKNARILLGLDISAVPTEQPEGNEYRISLRLPQPTDTERIIGMIFLCENGSAEYYRVTWEDGMATFTVPHFSEYYLVVENTVNLLPLLIVLSLLVLGEVCFLIFLYRKKIGRCSLRSLLPYPVLTCFLPKHAGVFVTLLSVSAVSLGIWIAVLWTAEKKRKKASSACRAELAAKAAVAALPFSPPQAKLPEREAILSLPEALETVPKITLPEAEALMANETARLLQRVEKFPVERCIGTRRGEINIDTIAEHFEAYDTVSLNALKAKKLIPQNVGQLKILARGVLDKPLTVCAQNFSTSALKMILLTGGVPVVIPPASERGKS